MARPSPCVLSGLARKHSRWTEGSSGSERPARVLRQQRQHEGRRVVRPGERHALVERAGAVAAQDHDRIRLLRGVQVRDRRTAGTSARPWPAPARPRELPRGAHASTSGPPLGTLWQPARSPGSSTWSRRCRRTEGPSRLVSLVSHDRRPPDGHHRPPPGAPGPARGVQGSSQELRARTVPRGAGRACRAPGRPRPAAGPNGGGRCRCAVVKARARVFRPCSPSSATPRPERGTQAFRPGRLPGPLRVAPREVPRHRPQSHHRRRQRRLSPRDVHGAARARGPPALRGLPRQPR